MDALRKNIAAVLGAVGVPVIGVCKANGYGLGLVPLARTLLDCGVSTLAVATLEEAQALREAGLDGAMLLLSSTALPAEAEQILHLGLIGTVGSAASAQALERAAAAAGATLPVHLKLDCGFGRFGFLPGEEAQAAQALADAPHLRVEGVFSHLSQSFSTGPVTAQQCAAFLAMLGRLKALGVDPPMRHLANSCAALIHPDTRLDAVRIGSAFAGRLPMPTDLKLQPVGRFVCEVAELHQLPKGHNVGYTNVYRTRRPTTAAVLTAGLADGLLRVHGKDAFRPFDRLRYLWHAVKGLAGPQALCCTINGHRVPTIGRVGTSGTVVDVTGLPVEVGDLACFAVNPMFIDSAVQRVYIETEQPAAPAPTGVAPQP
ncbi:MAG: alanine racemase [Clostridiales bacterium]|nr:alanine racemase [Clostridiales bacterium]